VSHDPSEIIVVCHLLIKKTFLIITIVENRCAD